MYVLLKALTSHRVNDDIANYKTRNLCFLSNVGQELIYELCPVGAISTCIRYTEHWWSKKKNRKKVHDDK